MTVWPSDMSGRNFTGSPVLIVSTGIYLLVLEFGLLAWPIRSAVWWAWRATRTWPSKDDGGGGGAE